MNAPLHRLTGLGRCHTCGEPSWIDECKVCFTLRTRPWQPMCGDRVLADQWTGVVAAQHGPFSWVVIDGISVPQTHATIALRPVDNDHAE